MADLFTFAAAQAPRHAPPGTPDLAACPTCGQPVRRVHAQPVKSPTLSAPLSVSRARQAGFTVLKRTSQGEFEKQ